MKSTQAKRDGAEESPARTARERILEAAAELFYREGIRAVGIDTIIARSGVAKMSLYRNFPSKDDLVVAFLERADRAYWERWDREVSKHPGAPRAQIRALFAGLGRRVARPDYRGCPFINTAVEFPEPDHPARAVCLANKRKLRERLHDLAAAAGAREPDTLADQLHLLMDGVYAAAQTLGSGGPASQVEAAADALVAAQL